MELVLEIYTNKIVLSENGKNVTTLAEKSFSTSRLLVGDFEAAEDCVRRAAKELGIFGLFKMKPSVIVKPKEKVEGGISPIEDRVFRELALTIGAKKVSVVI